MAATPAIPIPVIGSALALSSPPGFAAVSHTATVPTATFPFESASRKYLGLSGHRTARIAAAATRNIVMRDRIHLHRAVTTFASGKFHGITLVGRSFGDGDLLLLPEPLPRL